MGAWTKIGTALARAFGMGELAEKVERLREKNVGLAKALKRSNDVADRRQDQLTHVRLIAQKLWTPKPEDREKPSWSAAATAVWELRRLYDALQERYNRLEEELDETRAQLSRVVTELNRRAADEIKEDLSENPYYEAGEDPE